MIGNDSNAVRSARQAYAVTESRRDAAFWRNEIMMNRAEGCCEACGLFAPYMMDLHHVKPVRDGGGGGPENLIALCANCHRCVTAFYRYPHGNKACDVESCVARVYEPDVASFLSNLAGGRAALEENGQWRSWSLYAK